jgi:hypothetical protein
VANCLRMSIAADSCAARCWQLDVFRRIFHFG